MVTIFAPYSSSVRIYVAGNLQVYYPLVNTLGHTYRVGVAIPTRVDGYTVKVGCRPEWAYDDIQGHLYWGSHEEHSCDHYNFQGTLEWNAGVKHVYDYTVETPEGGIINGVGPVLRNKWSLLLEPGCDYHHVGKSGSIQIDARFRCRRGQSLGRDVVYVCEVNCYNHLPVPYARSTVLVFRYKADDQTTWTAVPDMQFEAAMEYIWDDTNTYPDTGWSNVSERTFSLPTILTRDKLVKQARAHLRQLGEAIEARAVGPARLDVLGELATTATSACKSVSANTFLTMVETYHWKSEAKAIGNELRAHMLNEQAILREGTVKSLRRMLNLRLSLKWGLPLTAVDLSKISQAIVHECMTHWDPKVNNWRTCRARRRNIAVTIKGLPTIVDAKIDYVMKIIYRDSAKALEYAGVKRLADYNIGSLTSVWDAIPYSFVIDWFTRIEDVLDQVDNLHYRLAFFDMKGSVWSSRLQCTLSNTELSKLGLPYTGNLNCIVYHRRAVPTVPLPTARFHSSGLGLEQWIDGLSLLQQRI